MLNDCIALSTLSAPLTQKHVHGISKWLGSSLVRGNWIGLSGWQRFKRVTNGYLPVFFGQFVVTAQTSQPGTPRIDLNGIV